LTQLLRQPLVTAGQQVGERERERRLPESAKTALAKVQAQLTKVDFQINEVGIKLENAADEFQEAERWWTTLEQQWADAEEAVEQDADVRLRAAALRRVVDRIVVTFQPSGKKRPIGRVVAIDVIAAPVAGDAEASMKGDVRPCALESPRK
jgi:hypothetical protein